MADGHGEFPARNRDVDHINGVRGDNRLANLRVVTRSQNNQNQRKPRAGKSSRHIGVCWAQRDGKWAAYIKAGARRLSLGYHDTEEAAAEAYRRAKAELHIATKA